MSNVNSEGYSDPTFFAALANIEAEEKAAEEKAKSKKPDSPKEGNKYIERDVRGWYDYIWQKARNEVLGKRKQKEG